MSSEQLHDRLLAGVEQARMAGSPVAGGKPADQELIVETAVRRWSSFPRRNRKVGGDLLERRIEDLAKGLCSRLEQQPSLVGPLMNDYRWLAQRLAEVFEQVGAPSGD
jgi:hypothetical protein